MDLAYTDMKAYASGVEANNTVEAATVTKPDNIDQAALLKTDIYGKPIYTLWKWIAEADWIGDFLKLTLTSLLLMPRKGAWAFPVCQI